jgi:hypothetical protein
LAGAGREGEPTECGPLLDRLAAADRGELAMRLRHLREVQGGGQREEGRIIGVQRVSTLEVGCTCRIALFKDNARGAWMILRS